MLLFTNVSYVDTLWDIVLPYIGSYLMITYVFPTALMVIGFGREGIFLHSIVSWIQSKFGVSYLLSLLQSLGARGGIPYPKFWSFISGSMVNIFKPLKNWQTVPASVSDNNKSNQSYCGCKIWLIFLPFVFWYFRHYLNNLRQFMTNRIVPVNRPSNQHTTEIIREPEQGVQRTTVPVRTTNSSTPVKVIERLTRNSSGKYTCPKCKRQCMPQGITNHVKSCAKEWCKRNEIYLDKN
jgi:hypothetical protein